MAVSFLSNPSINLHNSTPVFNKRIFKAQAGIVLTEEILAILNRPLREGRSKTELHKLKSVVNGLKDIHKGLQFIKDALSYVVGYEKVGPNVEIKKQSTESDLSCYYILNGSIEATYIITNGDSDDGKEDKADTESFLGKNIDKCKRTDGYEISYTHIAGDYLGLVSGDGPEYDLPSPHAIRTIEVCEFLRIDRNKFHQAVRAIHSHHVQEIEHFINSGSILKHLPLEERQKLVPLTARQEYPAGKVIVSQGDFPEHIFFIGNGRCQFFRRVYIKEAKRLELVRLGHIEKGNVFGESSVLDGSPCFCSVSSIGQVTCYLINKWAIKHNEHVLSLLREHQHHFQEDSIIQHYIRDSDVWQSYKRSKITELLEATSRHHIMIDKKHVPEALAIAVDFGDANRSHSCQSLREREPGEPESKRPLFIVPRSRRRSSAILQSNAAAVVKAVLLLRRNAEEKDKEALTFPMVKPPIGQQSRIKPNSAPSRYRSINSTMEDVRSRNTSHSSTQSTGKHKEKKMIQSHEDSPSLKDNQAKKKLSGNVRRPKSVNYMHSSDDRSSASKCRPKSRGASKDSRTSNNESRFSHSKRVTISDGKRNVNRERSSGLRKEKTPKYRNGSPTQDANASTERNKDKQEHFIQNEKKTKKSAEGIEKFVSTSGNFIIKEIINTGNPKRLSLPQGYQRFGASMFAILDNQKELEGNKNLGPNPWGVSYAASKWMAGIRRKRLRMLKETDQGSSPAPTPLIVIEEYVPEKQHHSDDESTVSDSDYSSEELDFQSDKDSNHKKKVSRRPRSTSSPSLEQLTEENDQDIEEYDKYEAGKAVEERWYTPIHEARDQSLSHLERVRKELEVLRCVREERRRRHGNREKENPMRDEEMVSDDTNRSEENQHEMKDGDSRATEESQQTSPNQKHRQRKYSTRTRSRTYSMSTVPDSQMLEGSSKSSGSLRMRRKCSTIQMRHTASDQASSGKINKAEDHRIRCDVSEETITNENRPEKLTKHQRRRLLLLEKIGF